MTHQDVMTVYVLGTSQQHARVRLCVRVFQCLLTRGPPLSTHEGLTAPEVLSRGFGWHLARRCRVLREVLVDDRVVRGRARCLVLSPQDL